MVYDLLIIGGGPAGLTAGVYARTRKLSTLILEALAMGMGLFEPKRLDVPGETELEGKGVEYRVRDRHEFKGKRVIVVGGGDSALEIALEIFAAAKQVILVHRRGEFRAMEKSVEAVLKSPIQVLFNSEVTSIEGEGRV